MSYNCKKECHNTCYICKKCGGAKRCMFDGCVCSLCKCDDWSRRLVIEMSNQCDGFEDKCSCSKVGRWHRISHNTPSNFSKVLITNGYILKIAEFVQYKEKDKLQVQYTDFSNLFAKSNEHRWQSSIRSCWCIYENGWQEIELIKYPFWRYIDRHDIPDNEIK